MSVHNLKHSFATRLLESGIGLRFIEEILGHKSSNIAEIYIHSSNEDMDKTKSPLGNLSVKQKRESSSRTARDGIFELGSQYSMRNYLIYSKFQIFRYIL